MSTLCNPLNREQFNSFPDDSKERGRDRFEVGHVSQMLLVACKGLKSNFAGILRCCRAVRDNG